jgi:tRNA(Ile)-lysidine synthase
MNADVETFPIHDDEFADLMEPFCLNEKVAIAVSGGMDSMALTFLMQSYSLRRQLKSDAISTELKHSHFEKNNPLPDIICLTVDHRLRENSTKKAHAVHDLLSSHKINHQILTWNHAIPPLCRLQEEARKARFQLLEKWCEENNISTLLMAHHGNDQIETFFMRLNHQSNLKGLSAIRPLSFRGKLRIIRPLLGVSKSRLKSTLEERGISWFDDPSNENCNFERVQLRKSLEPLLFEKTFNAASILKSIEKLQAVDSYFDYCVTNFIKQNDSHFFSLSLFLAQHTILRIAILKAYIAGSRQSQKHTGRFQYYPPSEKAVKKLNDAIASPDFKAATLGGFCFKKLKGDKVKIFLENR